MLARIARTSVGSVETLEFDVCEDCLEYPNQIVNFTTTTAGLAFCEACGVFKETAGFVEAKVKTLKIEPCDCYEKHGKTNHNDGGNYHQTYFTTDLFIMTGFKRFEQKIRRLKAKRRFRKRIKLRLHFATPAIKLLFAIYGDAKTVRHKILTCYPRLIAQWDYYNRNSAGGSHD